MNTYLIGDIQGCTAELQALTESLDLRDEDEIWLLGDLINRGPDSLGALRQVRQWGDRCRVVLGNHDLSVLARLFTADPARPLKGAAAEIDAAPDRDELVQWLRHQPLAHYDRGCLMVHAGLPPQWDLDTTLDCAREVEAQLRGADVEAFFARMYGDEPAIWSGSLSGMPRWRFITNCLTRLRYCRADGSLALAEKGPPAALDSADLVPWFAHPARASRDTLIACGHWSTLGRTFWPQHRLWSLDTGCVWGGALTALHLESRRLIRMPGQAYRQPGT